MNEGVKSFPITKSLEKTSAKFWNWGFKHVSGLYFLPPRFFRDSKARIDSVFRNTERAQNVFCQITSLFPVINPTSETPEAIIQRGCFVTRRESPHRLVCISQYTGTPEQPVIHFPTPNALSQTQTCETLLHYPTLLHSHQK